MKMVTFGLIAGHDCVEPSVIVFDSVFFERLAKFLLVDEGLLSVTEVRLEDDLTTDKKRLDVNAKLADSGLSVFNFVISCSDLDILLGCGIYTDKVTDLFKVWQEEIEKNSQGVAYVASGDDGKIATHLAKSFLTWRASGQ